MVQLIFCIPVLMHVDTHTIQYIVPFFIALVMDAVWWNVCL